MYSFGCSSSQLSLENRLNEPVEVLGDLIVDVKARLLSILELHLVDVTVRIADYRWIEVIRQVRSLGQGDELRTNLSHTLFHRLLHRPIRSLCKEATVIHSLAILKKLLERPNLAGELQDLPDAGISEVSCGALSSVEVELKVLEMSASHGHLCLVEELVVFDLC